jgi:hypothetical protein
MAQQHHGINLASGLIPAPSLHPDILKRVHGLREGLRPNPRVPQWTLLKYISPQSDIRSSAPPRYPIPSQKSGNRVCDSTNPVPETIGSAVQPPIGILGLVQSCGGFSCTARTFPIFMLSITGRPSPHASRDTTGSKSPKISGGPIMLQHGGCLCRITQRYCSCARDRRSMPVCRASPVNRSYTSAGCTSAACQAYCRNTLKCHTHRE